MLKESLIRKTYLIGVIFEVICFLNQVGSFGVTSQGNYNGNFNIYLFKIRLEYISMNI